MATSFWWCFNRSSVVNFSVIADLPWQSDGHNNIIKPRPDLIQLLSPPSQHQTLKSSNGPENPSPRCLQQLVFISNLLSLSIYTSNLYALCFMFYACINVLFYDEISYFLLLTCLFYLPTYRILI